jgi:predicted metal-dependent hydrolase
MPQADPRFHLALELFNAGEWYAAHDVFEELWHETADPERRSLQGILQVAVAQLHLQRGNRRGATILYGEALGRLKRPGTPDLGLDLEALCCAAQQRLEALQLDRDPESCTVPVLRLQS